MVQRGHTDRKKKVDRKTECYRQRKIDKERKGQSKSDREQHNNTVLNQLV